MPEIEYAVDIWDLSGTDGRPDAEPLLEHLREFAAQGWELVWSSFNIGLVRHGPSHLLVFKRAEQDQSFLSPGHAGIRPSVEAAAVARPVACGGPCTALLQATGRASVREMGAGLESWEGGTPWPLRANLRPSPRHGARWHRALVAVVLLAAAGCTGVGDTQSTPRSTQPPPAPTGTGVTVPAFDPGRFAAVIPLPGAGSLAVASGMLWVLDAAGMVVRVDPATNVVVGKPLRVPADAAAIAVAQGALWVARVAPGDLVAPGKDSVARIDLATGRTLATVTVGRAPLDVAATAGRSG